MDTQGLLPRRMAVRLANEAHALDGVEHRPEPPPIGVQSEPVMLGRGGSPELGLAMLAVKIGEEEATASGGHKDHMLQVAQVLKQPFDVIPGWRGFYICTHRNLLPPSPTHRGGNGDL